MARQKMWHRRAIDSQMSCVTLVYGRLWCRQMVGLWTTTGVQLVLLGCAAQTERPWEFKWPIKPAESCLSASQRQRPIAPNTHNTSWALKYRAFLGLRSRDGPPGSNGVGGTEHFGTIATIHNWRIFWSCRRARVT